MFGSTIVFILAVAVVATYILIVNRFLRSDEHWNESTQSPPPVTRQPAAEVAPQSRRPACLTPNHA